MDVIRKLVAGMQSLNLNWEGVSVRCEVAKVRNKSAALCQGWLSLQLGFHVTGGREQEKRETLCLFLTPQKVLGGPLVALLE